MRITFTEVAVKGTRRWTDETGKRRQQTRKFWQTVNPFNTNPDGSIKTRDQILVEVKAQRDEWLRAEPTPQPPAAPTLPPQP